VQYLYQGQAAVALLSSLSPYIYTTLPCVRTDFLKKAFYLLTMCLCLPGRLPAAEPADDAATGFNEATVDLVQHSVSENINQAAQWVDSFFDDERYIAEDATTKLRFGQSVFLEYGNNPEFKTRLNLSVDVPRTENRLRLFVGGDDESNNSSVTPTGIDSQNRDGSAAGVQFFAKASDRQNLSLVAGVKVSSTELFTGPRYRRTFKYHDWQLVFTEGVRWYTSRGWESRTRFDYERLLDQRLFFRQTLQGRWREEDAGYQYEFISSIAQPIHHRKAVVYQWATLFETHPHQRLASTVVRMRYRQNFWRKWLFYEMNPQLAMRNDEHFKPKAGIVLSLEVVFGGKTSRRGDTGDTDHSDQND
jgi:hypothetical protein